MCTYINNKISTNDIVAIHRVPHAQKDINRPKNIIIKLTSRWLRDNILSAFRHKGKVTSNNLDIHGTPHKLYMNEHLTINNKKLFRECREAAKKHNFKYGLGMEPYSSGNMTIKTVQCLLYGIRRTSQPESCVPLALSTTMMRHRHGLLHHHINLLLHF